MEKWHIESGPIIWPFKLEARSWRFPCRHLPVTRADSGGTTIRPRSPPFHTILSPKGRTSSHHCVKMSLIS